MAANRCELICFSECLRLALSENVGQFIGSIPQYVDINSSEQYNKYL